MNVDRYKELLNSNDFDEIYISSEIPSITKSQYKRGYIQRSFIQKSNDILSNLRCLFKGEIYLHGLD